MKWQGPYLLLQPVCDVLGCGAVVLVVVKELPLPKRQKEHENQIVSESRLQQRAEWRLGNVSLKTTAKDVCDLMLFVNITTCITATLLHLILKTHPTQNMPSKKICLLKTSPAVLKAQLNTNGQCVQYALLLDLWDGGKNLILRQSLQIF